MKHRLRYLQRLGWMARRNLARSLATVMWGMWKSGSVFDPSQVGKTLTMVN